jgi:hypothetical protein
MVESIRQHAFAVGQPAPGWALLESVSFCRPANEVSLW